MALHLPMNYGTAFAKFFYLRDAPSILLKPRTRTQLAVTRLTLDHGMPEPSASPRPEKAFTISVHLRDPDCTGWGTWIDQRFVKVKSWRTGGVGIYDFEADPRALRRTPFDAVHYNLPRTTLNAFTDDHGLPTVDALQCEQGTPDPVLYHLTQMILPTVDSHVGLPDLFFDYFVFMLCSRVVSRYSTDKAAPQRFRGGLAPWQMRRTREILDSHPRADLRLAALAHENRLSISHFARSFKQSFGLSFHRYLVMQRVEKAKELLRYSNRSLAAIALEVGFSDQPAFSRTFGALVGTSPRKWRNQFGRNTSRVRRSLHLASG
jgi:AraC family transcriptional regulator